MENWLPFFFIQHWKEFIKDYILNAFHLINHEKDFVFNTYPDPEIELPDLYELSPFPLLKQTKILINTRNKMIANSKLMISFFEFSYSIPIPHDFIIWRRLGENFGRYKYENLPKSGVNCVRPLQIKFHPYFVVNFINKQRRNAQRENKLIYRPTPVKKVKLEIPKTTIKQCSQINATKKYLHSLNKTSQLLIKFGPFANLNSLRENMLYEIRKNYISKDELFNSAHKHYNFWTNLATEDINNIIKNNSPILTNKWFFHAMQNLSRKTFTTFSYLKTRKTM
jgi:hypothetical protein